MKLPDKSQFLFYDMMQKAKAPENCWVRWQRYDPALLNKIAKKLEKYGSDPKSFVRGWDYFDTVADAEDYDALANLTDIEQTVLVGETYENHMRRNRDPYLTFAKEKSGRLTISQVNKAIRHTGLEIERIKDGYFIFIDKKTKNSIDAPSVMVNRVWDLPLQEWVNTAEAYAKEYS